MTTYTAIETLINGKVFATYDEAWNAIFNAYKRNKIDGYELDSLSELADAKLN